MSTYPKRLSSGVLLCLIVLANNPAARTQTPEGSQQSSTQLLISISDKHKNAESVFPSDLTLSIDGQPVPIRDLRLAKDIPLRFLVLLDLSNSNRDKVDFERKAGSQLFESLSTSPNNTGYLGWFSLETHVSSHPVSAPEATQWIKAATVAGPTALYDAIAQTCTHTLHRDSGAKPVRRLLFVITDGEDDQSRFSIAEAVKAAQREGIPIFALGLLSSPSSRGTGVLKKLAKETGGNAVVLEQPGRFLEKLLQPLDSQYFLTFDPGPSQPGKSQKVELKSPNRQLEIMAPTAF